MQSWTVFWTIVVIFNGKGRPSNHDPDEGCAVWMTKVGDWQKFHKSPRKIHLMAFQYWPLPSAKNSFAISEFMVKHFLIENGLVQETTKWRLVLLSSPFLDIFPISLHCSLRSNCTTGNILIYSFNGGRSWKWSCAHL